MEAPDRSGIPGLVNNNEEKGTWKGKSTDSNSFGIQLAGMQDHEGNFTELDEAAYFWTATEYDRENAEYFSYMIVTDKHVVDVSRKRIWQISMVLKRQISIQSAA